MRSKFFCSLLVVILTFCIFSFTALAAEHSEVVDTTTITSTSALSNPTSVTVSDDTVIDELEHINKHLDFFTTVTAFAIVVFVIVVLWLLFGRWFFRY